MLAALFGLTLSQALAGSPAHYHPDVVARQSTVFGQAAAKAGPSFENAQHQLRQVGDDLSALEQGVLLLGADAPHETQVWSDGIRKQVTGRFLQIQRHVDLLQDDYSRVFSSALERAVAQAGEGKSLVECKASGGIESIMRRGGVTECVGEDANAALVKIIDADRILIADIEEINGVPWPQIEVEPKAQPVSALSGQTNWVSSAAVVSLYADGAVQRRQDDLDRALAPLADAMAQGDTTAIEKGRELRLAYVNGLAQDGDVLWSAVAVALEKGEKRGGPTEIGVCANPVSLGGCAGDDLSEQLLERLAADKKFLKTVASLGS